MTRRTLALTAATLLVLGTVGRVSVGWGDEAPAGVDPEIGRTPPRLSFIEGQVSFWRPGAEDWVAAQVNTPLAPGDELYTGSPGNLEVQVGARAFARAWASTQLGLASLEPDFLQLKVTAGHVSLDVRGLDPGHTVEVDTPNAALTIERAGYYRVTVTPSRTSFVARRGGRATLTPANGPAAAIGPSEEVVVEGTDSTLVATSVAPPLDEWDRWNYARTDQLIDAVSARYVSPGVYGIDDLDHHGAWRIIEPHGPVWVPDGVPADWAPYSTGAWMWDPRFGWTWVDSAPWGWAPYHYGRWVFVGGFWAWTPGPVVVAPVYAPALVAFLGGRVSVGVVGPAVGWVALGWGEPLIPWWGPIGFIGVPCWAGWGGPRIVNNVVINRTTVVNVTNIIVYRNVKVRKAVVVVPRERFGRGPVTRVRAAQADPTRLEPVRGTFGVAPVRASLVPDGVRGLRPPDATLRRTVVATRAPEHPARWLRPQGSAEPSTALPPPPRLVPKPARPDRAVLLPGAPLGPRALERPRPPQPPRFERLQPRSARPGPPAVQPPWPPPAARPATQAPAVQRPAPPATDVEARPAPRVGLPPAAPWPHFRPVTSPRRVEPRPAPPEALVAPRVERGPVAPATPPSRVQAPAWPVQPAPRPELRSLPRGPANGLFPGRSGPAPGRGDQPSPSRPGAASRGPDDGDRSQPPGLTAPRPFPRR
jgi:hypothetical protein